MDSPARLSGFMMFILIGSTVVGLVFRAISGDLWIENLLTNLPGGQLGFLIIANLLMLSLAFFLDYFERAFILEPLLVPAAAALGIGLVLFGVLLSVNMQSSFLTPPFGFALFFLRSVVPATIKTGEISRGFMPFIYLIMWLWSLAYLSKRHNFDTLPLCKYEP